MRRQIHNAIHVAVEMGLPKRWLSEFLPMEFVLPQTSAERDNRPKQLKPMSFEQAIASITFYILATVASLCVFAWEVKMVLFIILKKILSLLYKCSIYWKTVMVEFAMMMLNGLEIKSKFMKIIQ